MPSWDHAQYLKFEDARTRPAAELLARVSLTAAELVVDLGCGPGNSTELLRARWPKAELVGMDSSADMLQRARQVLPDVRFEQADVRDYRSPRPCDVLFANAVLQWLPEHTHLLPQLFAQLRPGGVLALQMPDNWQEPSHRQMRELAERYGLSGSQVGARGDVLTPEVYYDLLVSNAATSVDIWRTRYEHVMPDAAAIVEWLRGTGLRPYLDALDAEPRAAFLRDYEREIERAYPPRADGRRLFSFPRLFVVATRA
jgi:trans-aconitate 2-methyltransferase